MGVAFNVDFVPGFLSTLKRDATLLRNVTSEYE